MTNSPLVDTGDEASVVDAPVAVYATAMVDATDGVEREAETTDSPQPGGTSSQPERHCGSAKRKVFLPRSPNPPSRPDHVVSAVEQRKSPRRHISLGDPFGDSDESADDATCVDEMPEMEESDSPLPSMASDDSCFTDTEETEPAQKKEKAQKEKKPRFQFFMRRTPATPTRSDCSTIAPNPNPDPLKLTVPMAGETARSPDRRPRGCGYVASSQSKPRRQPAQAIEGLAQSFGADATAQAPARDMAIESEKHSAAERSNPEGGRSTSASVSPPAAREHTADSARDAACEHI